MSKNSKNMDDKKYIVLLENKDGYISCEAVCITKEEAYGSAYLSLVDGIDESFYYVTLPEFREGGGIKMELRDRRDYSLLTYATIITYK